MAFDEIIRSGAGNLKMDDVGGDFSAATDLGKTSEEGIKITYNGDVKKVKSAQSTMLSLIRIIAEEGQLECAIEAHKMEALALALGYDSSDITDTAGTPSSKSIQVGGVREIPAKAFQIKIPQPTDPTLFDYITIPKAQAIPKFEQAYTYNDVRYIPITLVMLENSSGYLFEIKSEYTA